MIEPIAVLNLLLLPCLAYVAGALLFWVVTLCRRDNVHKC